MTASARPTWFTAAAAACLSIITSHRTDGGLAKAVSFNWSVTFSLAVERYIALHKQSAVALSAIVCDIIRLWRVWKPNYVSEGLRVEYILLVRNECNTDIITSRYCSLRRTKLLHSCVFPAIRVTALRLWFVSFSFVSTVLLRVVAFPVHFLCPPEGWVCDGMYRKINRQTDERDTQTHL